MENSKRHWIVKQEPEAYSWTQFVSDKKTNWTGVRNFQARNHLRQMQKGDDVFYYHSVTGKEIVGLATVIKVAFPDPTAKEGDWSAVEIKPVKALKQPVTLERMKADPLLKNIPLIKQSRLSVSPLTATEFARIQELSETEIIC